MGAGLGGDMRRIVLGLCLIFFAGVARAEGMVDCTTPAFAATMKLKPGYQFDCVEMARETLSAGGGVWQVRAVRSKATEGGQIAPYVQAAISDVQDAVKIWEPYANAMGFSFGHVTFVFSDPLESEVDFATKLEALGSFEAFGLANNYTFPQECVVLLNIPVVVKSSLENFRSLIAHEAFHCVQGFSFPQSNNVGDGAEVWWVEGTAVLFAALVQTEAALLDQGFLTFSKGIGEKPITQRAYDTGVFFAYLLQQGPEVLGKFFKGLAKAPGEAAQIQAAQAALGEEVLDGFARAFFDGTISLPSGYTFPGAPEPEPQIITDAVEIPSGKVPFTVDMRVLSFVGADFAVADAARYEVRDMDAKDWGDMPNEVKLENCKEPRDLAAVRFVGSLPKDTLGFPIVASVIKKCDLCQALPDLEKCLVGTWKLRPEEMLSWLQKKTVGNDEVRYTDAGGTVLLTLGADGTAQWVIEGLKIGAVIEPTVLEGLKITIDVEGDGIAPGQWSTGAGQMNFCAQPAQMDFTSRVKIPYQDEDVVTEGMPAENVYAYYSCNPKSLMLSYIGPVPIEGDPPEWHLDRIK